MTLFMLLEMLTGRGVPTRKIVINDKPYDLLAKDSFHDITDVESVPVLKYELVYKDEDADEDIPYHYIETLWE